MFSMQFLSPSVRATLAVLATAFVGGFLGFLEPQIDAGIPPENAWRHILAGALVAGAIAAYHRWQPSPAQVATLMVAIGIAVFPVAAAGCTWWKANGVGVTQDAAAIAACIERDAIAGDSLAQIAIDCGADVATAIGTVITSLDSRVQASPAAAEARRARAAVLPDAGR